MSFSHITSLLAAASAGDRSATEELFSTVYNELRKTASIQMAGEEIQTLQPTALVHEVWIKLFGSNKPTKWNDRTHFCAAAAQAMRRILIDSAKARKRQKRGGGKQCFSIREDDALIEADENLLALDEALELLRDHDPVKAELVCLRYFGGLTNIEAAQQMGLSLSSAERGWVFAKAWLREKIETLE